MWGAVLCCLAGVQNYSGALAVRFFLGVFEAAVTPGFALFTSQVRPFAIFPGSRGLTITVVHQKRTRDSHCDLVQFQRCCSSIRWSAGVWHCQRVASAWLVNCPMEDCLPGYGSVDINSWRSLPVFYAGQPAERSMAK